MTSVACFLETSEDLVLCIFVFGKDDKTLIVLRVRRWSEKRLEVLCFEPLFQVLNQRIGL